METDSMARVFIERKKKEDDARQPYHRVTSVYKVPRHLTGGLIGNFSKY